MREAYPWLPYAAAAAGAVFVMAAGYLWRRRKIAATN
jgi:LPXTG-motif cell wall-anchored protein